MTIKVMQPKGINIPNYQKAVDAGLLAGAELARTVFYETYHNWETENYPDWVTKGPSTEAGTRKLTYSTTSTPYVYVSNGTPEHTIASKQPGGFLRFKAGSKPKTFPNRLQSMAGMPGTNWVTAKEVNNPGIEARNFPQSVAPEIQTSLANIVQSNIDKVVLS